jgi:hypothetical protein
LQRSNARRVGVAGTVALGLLALSAPSAFAAGASPRATFTVTPAAPVAGQQVTFDASATQCYGTAWTSTCSSFKWEDDGEANEPLDSPIALGTGQKFSFTFKNAGTKYVWLTVTDAAGRQTQTMTPVVVSAAPTTTTPTTPTTPTEPTTPTTPTTPTEPTAPTSPTTPTAPSTSGDYLLVSAAKLASQPTSGAAWDYLNTQANAARSQVTFSAGGAATDPQLRNYENSGRYGQKILAVAVRYARTKDAADRAFVEKALRYVIGTETRASTDGTSTSDGLLATMRNLPAFIAAADFIKFDKSLTGSRSGWTGTSFASWLASLRTKTIGTHSRWNQITATSIDSANNWGAAAMAARTMIAVYLGSVDKALTDHWHRWMGDVTYGTDFNKSSDYDASWVCFPDGSWASGKVRRPINPDGCGAGKSGLVVEDIARSAGSYPSTDGTGLAYTNEHLHFIATAALAMKQAGYPVHTWGATPGATPTLKLAGDWVQRSGNFPTLGGSNIHKELPWMLNSLLGTSYTSTAPAMGRMISYAEYWGK